MKKRRQVYFFLLAAAIAWCGLIMLPPILDSLNVGVSSISHMLYRGFSRICHQLDSHSLHLFGNPLAVCARCTGIYFGFLAGVFLMPLMGDIQARRFTALFLLGLLPMIADVALDGLGIFGSSIGSRLTTGGIFGITVGVLLTPILLDAIGEFIQQSIRRFSNFQSNNPSEG